MCPRTPSDRFFPKSWPRVARSAVLHAISLASTAVAVVRDRAGNSRSRRTRQLEEVEHLRNEITLLREELQLKDARMAAVRPPRRPGYRPIQRMAILELRAQRGWSLVETSERFLVEPRTIAAWIKRLDGRGERALVQTPMPVNKYPDFVRYLVQRLKVLCPLMGKRRIAETLARAGLHLGATTIQRMVTRGGPDAPVISSAGEIEGRAGRSVTGRVPNHVWHVDLTVVPTRAGFWTMLRPFASLQRWPFGYWIAVVVDHFSRRAVGFAIFRKRPTAREVTAFLGRAVQIAGTKPRHIATDKGRQFWCATFKRWCRRRRIRSRFGAVGKHGSIAIVERFIRSMKTECCRRIAVPMQMGKIREELSLYLAWYNHHRPHQGLAGRTPDEVYFHRRPANKRPRYEPRRRWSRRRACPSLPMRVKGECGAPLALQVRYVGGRRHLPIVALREAA